VPAGRLVDEAHAAGPGRCHFLRCHLLHLDFLL
jgi:hypothetical protein